MYTSGKKRILKTHNNKSKQKHNFIATLIATILLILIIILLICQLTPLCKLPWKLPGLNIAKNKSTQTELSNKPQLLRLTNDILSITNGNNVDLSIYKYYAGEGLILENNTFSLKESGVTPGYYGSSYTIPVFHVDKYGRITSVTQVPIITQNSTEYTAGNGITIDDHTISVDAPTCEDTEKLVWTGSGFSCVPDHATLDGVICNEGEILQYVGGTWICTEFIPHSIFDTDKDTGIETEHNPDEDIIRFYTSGNQVAKIDSSGDSLFSQTDLASLTDVDTFTGMLLRISKGAVRIGFTDNTNWDDTNIGNYSFAAGYNPLASGDYSFASGYETHATGTSSVAMGSQTQAAGQYSAAFGNNTMANGESAMAWGSNTTASDLNTTAWGNSTTANRRSATAWGDSTTASGQSATAWGSSTTASNRNATAWGQSTTASGQTATAWGNSTTASEQAATAWGTSTNASAINATAWGENTQATAERSTAFGYNSVASGINSLAVGNNVTASGPHSIALGDRTRAYGDSSIALGKLSFANNLAAVAFGTASQSLGIDSMAWGYTARATADYSTAFGYNTRAQNEYAVTFGLNTQATGRGAVAGHLSTIASGDFSFAMGNGTVANSYLMSVFGQFNIELPGQDTQHWQDSDFLFVVGNGTSASHKHNALTILKNGYTGLGDYDPVANLVIGDDTNADYVNGLGDVYIQNDLEVDGTIYANDLHANNINLPNFTPGSVLFIDNNHNIAENPVEFFWDFTNNFLGIGLNNPQEKLDINGNLRIEGNIYPAQDNTFDLGTDTNRWRDLYLGGTTIHIGENGNEGTISYDTATTNLKMQANQISLLGPNNTTINISDTGITLDVGQSGNLFKLITSNIIDGLAQIGDVLSVKDTTSGEMDFRHITEIEEGTANGQLLYWDNTAKAYKHSLATDFNDSSRTFIQWIPNTGLYLGRSGGTLIPITEALTVLGNIHLVQRYNHTSPYIYGANKNNYISLSSYNGSHTIIHSIGGTTFQTNGNNRSLTITGANIRIRGSYVDTNLVTLNDSPPQRVILLGGQTYNNHLDGVSLELLGMQPRSSSSAIYGGHIRIDGGLGRDSLPFENGKVLIGTRTQYTKVGVGTEKPKGYVDIVEPVLNYSCPTPSSVTATSTYPDGNHNANNAVDNNESTAWASENNQESLPSIVLEFPTAQKMEKVIFSYHLTDSVLNSYKYAPRTVGIAGSNDGTTWTSLRVDAPLYDDWSAANETRVFHVASNAAYKYYKFTVLSTDAWNNDHSQTLTGLYELKFCYIASVTNKRTLFINNGLIGIGTDNPTELLQVGEPGDGTVAIANAWTTFSDSNLKKNVAPIDHALEKIQHLEGVYYNWKFGNQRREIGLIAQKVQQVVPEVVYKRKKFMSIDYSKLTALLINAIKEFYAEANNKFTELFNIIKGPDNPNDPLYDSPNIGLLKVLTWSKKQVEFLRKVIFKQPVIFENTAQFNKPVEINDRITFNDYDMSGTAVIPARKREVKITFAKEYKNIPTVVVTAFDARVRYGIKDVSTKGFTIYITRTYSDDKKFNWIAVHNKNPNVP